MLEEMSAMVPILLKVLKENSNTGSVMISMNGNPIAITGFMNDLIDYVIIYFYHKLKA